MLTFALLAPVLNFHFFAVLVIVVAACLIVLWLLQKGKVPEPFNYVIYAALAIVALYILFWLLNTV